MTNALNILENMHYKIVGILRGITPSEIEAHLPRLLEAGFEAIEIPLNSPDAFTSIKIATDMIKAQGRTDLLIGAGTVLSVSDVEKAVACGGNLIVSPNSNTAVLDACCKAKVVSIPGFMTPTEAFQSISAGATALKLFPANLIGVDGLRAMKAVLPKDIDVLVVGGIDETQLGPYFSAGATGMGVGSSLYKPGQQPEETYRNARRIIGTTKSLKG